VTLNINARRKKRAETGERRALVEELLHELTSWNPRERMAEFRTWLKGSLSLIHLHVLSILGAEGPLPMSKLADQIDVSVASATGIVSRMEQRGLVERRHSDDDRRLVIVRATERGDHVLEVMARHRRIRLGKVVQHLTDEEIQAFLIGIQAMQRARAEALAAGEIGPTADAQDEAANDDAGRSS
jgi:DNA-binding MarR family transcriptional regulator